jgi:hypothetical protein
MRKLHSPALIKQSATHAAKLERWYGADVIETISRAMRDFYWPVPLAGAPGPHGYQQILTWKGDFIGSIAGGMAGFSSHSDFVAQASAGGLRMFNFQKVGTTGVIGSCNSLWRVGSTPAAGAAAAAAPGGTVPNDTTTGAPTFDNPVSGDTQHVVNAPMPSASVAGNCVMLYDRLFAVAKNMNSTATEAVTGVPTRYQSTTRGDMDFAGGNFIFPECGTVLAATAHNWTVCQYTDQDGNATQTIPSRAGNSGNIVNRFDLPAYYWFMPLAAGDDGIQRLTQMQLSAAVATGACDMVIGHPLCWIPMPLAATPMPLDLYNAIFGLNRIFDDACLALIEMMKPATTATTYNLVVQTNRG